MRHPATATQSDPIAYNFEASRPRVESETRKSVHGYRFGGLRCACIAHGATGFAGAQVVIFRGVAMDRGIDFLKSQINNSVMQHQTFLEAVESHEQQAEDSRFRDLCSRHIPRVREHQRMLEDYQQTLGAEAGSGKKIIGAMLGKARDLADAAHESDFLRLVGDIVMSRQAEDTFKTFRDAGRALGNTQLAQIGETCEQFHDEYNREANRLVQQMFVEHVRGVEPGTAQDTTSTRSGTIGA